MSGLQRCCQNFTRNPQSHRALQRPPPIPKCRFTDFVPRPAGLSPALSPLSRGERTGRSDPPTLPLNISLCISNAPELCKVSRGLK